MPTAKINGPQGTLANNKTQYKKQNKMNMYIIIKINLSTETYNPNTTMVDHQNITN